MRYGITLILPVKQFDAYPSVNLYYIGINETEFGFMDNDFSYDRTWGDYFLRLKEYGPLRLLKILIKKTFWLWTQGTYQAQRYAFGLDVLVATDKFETNTILTEYLRMDHQKLRMFINAFTRVQYFLMFGLMTLKFWSRKNIDHLRAFYYMFAGTFFVMLIYELKARYILYLLPFMVIIAVSALDEKKDENVLKGQNVC